MVHAQRKHQVGLGFDYSVYLSVPKDWKGNVNPFSNNKKSYNNVHRFYPSIHYTYDKKWQVTVMYQWYAQRAGEKKINNLPLTFEPFIYERTVYNLDFLVGRELLSLMPSKNNSSRKSSLFFHLGLRFVLNATEISKAEQFSAPPGHHYMTTGYYYPGNGNQQPFKLAAHLEYRYNIIQNLGINVNLNYGYIYKQVSPAIGQIGLRYTF